MNNPDRLYELLPVVYRQRDAEQGYPLRALLQVIAEQVDVVEDDIKRLYENWFIETCQDWVVPYIGDLIGYRIVHEAGEPGDVTTQQGRERNKILIPRREVANTIRYRRRKGTLALLELLANNVAGWPARAVEFYKLLGWTQNINHLHLHRGGTIDLRMGETLDRLNGPFDELGHTVDVRRINSHRTQGRYNVPSVGLFVWRFRSYSLTSTQANCIDRRFASYTFSILGNDVPLFTRPQRSVDVHGVIGELDVPTPIRRLDFELRDGKTVQANPAYYGPRKSLEIWTGTPPKPIPVEHIVPADLTHWHYRPQEPGYVAVDPQRGRMAFTEQQEGDVLVTYHYGFSTEMGGGEYERPLTNPSDDFDLFRVRTVFNGEGHAPAEMFPTLAEALLAAEKSGKPNVVIEICDSCLYEEHVSIKVGKEKSFQIRAANGTRPVILIPDERARRDTFSVTLSSCARFVMDGVVVAGRAVQVKGPEPEEKPAQVIIRHCTLVPGWLLDAECEPCCAEEPSLEVNNANCCIRIERSICGSVFVNNEAAKMEPIPIYIADSIIDATNSRFLSRVNPEMCRTFHAVSHEECGIAHAILTILRSTLIGDVRAHAIELAENSIFYGLVVVARRQSGCVRFCYVPPGSRTPRRYECQPDLVEKAVLVLAKKDKLSDTERDSLLSSERLRVEPQFNSTRYGTPTYCQLADSSADEIKRSADDESEMGAFHDLFQPQRIANLRACLDEYTPADMEAGIIFAS